MERETQVRILQGSFFFLLNFTTFAAAGVLWYTPNVKVLNMLQICSTHHNGLDL